MSETNQTLNKSKPLFAVPTHELSQIKKVIGVVSGKGGVGKSMMTALLAVTMNKLGYHTAIFDADITGPSIPKMFGLTKRAVGTKAGIYPVLSEQGIDIISTNLLLDNESEAVLWRGPILASVIKQYWSEVMWGEVDYLFIDLPPGTGDVPLTIYQSIPLDGVIMVTSPQQLVSMIVAKAVNMAEQMSVPILGIIENMAYFTCPDNNKKYEIFGQSHVLEVAAKYDLSVLAQLPLNPDLARLADQGKIEAYDLDYLANVAELLKLL